MYVGCIDINWKYISNIYKHWIYIGYMLKLHVKYIDYSHNLQVYSVITTVDY